MEYSIGSVLNGKVTGITKFGAFVTFEPGKTGLVHISEIANTFVSDVNQFLQIGQEVRVKILSLGDDGKMNLSIKKVVEAPASRENAPKPATIEKPEASAPAPKEEPKEKSFEDKLKQFMHESDSKIAGVRQYEKKPSRRRGSYSGGNDW